MRDGAFLWEGIGPGASGANLLELSILYQARQNPIGGGGGHLKHAAYILVGDDPVFVGINGCYLPFIITFHRPFINPK